MKTNTQHHAGLAARAFTLIELLVVFAIISILAALVISGTAYATKTVKIKRAQAELSEIIAALEAYKAKLGFYPPDSAIPAVPPLYYELSGMYDVGGGSFTTTDGGDTIATAAISAAFGVGGFANTAPDRAGALRFLGGLSGRKVHDSGGIRLLRLSVKNPGEDDDSSRVPVWRYVSRSPTNNPKSFDLWVDLIIRDQTNRVGNWRSGS